MPVALSLLLVLLVAPAAQAAEPRAFYGGGALVGETAREQSRHGGFLTGRINGDGGVIRLRGQVHLRCGPAALAHSIGLTPDGSFAAEYTRRDRFGKTPRRARFRFEGRVQPDAVEVTVRLRLSFKPGKRWRTCKGPVPMRLVRTRDASTTPATPAAGAFYGGTTSAGRGLAVRVNADGTKVAGFLFGYRQSCTGPIKPDPRATNNYSPPLAIATDGTFSSRERFKLRFTNGVERFVVRVRGQFVEGGVTGTVSVRSAFRRRSGRLVGRCRTGPMFFSAFP